MMESIERVQAAEFLGVSVSTLDRLASQGRLTRGRARRKTRPVTVFEVAELTRLKAELEESGRAVRATLREAHKSQDAVGFRLDPFYVERLRAEGAAVGMSAGEYARRLVVQSLETAAHGPASEGETGRSVANEVRALRPIVTEAIRASEEAAKASALSIQREMAEDMGSLREALAQAFYALLVMKMDTPEDKAREFVNKTIRRRRPFSA